MLHFLAQTPSRSFSHAPEQSSKFGRCWIALANYRSLTLSATTALRQDRRNPTVSAIFLSLSVALLLPGTVSAHAAQKLSPEVETFIQEMVQKHKFREAALRKVFAKVEPNQSILNAISTPLTARPWHEFRGRYVDAARINGGVKFWREHAVTLAAARKQFGVPEEIIVATIGVETTYGKYVGNHGVLEALSTLALNRTPRSALLRSELE